VRVGNSCSDFICCFIVFLCTFGDMCSELQLIVMCRPKGEVFYCAKKYGYEIFETLYQSILYLGFKKEIYMLNKQTQYNLLGSKRITLIYRHSVATDNVWWVFMYFHIYFSHNFWDHINLYLLIRIQVHIYIINAIHHLGWGTHWSITRTRRPNPAHAIVTAPCTPARVRAGSPRMAALSKPRPDRADGPRTATTLCDSVIFHDSVNHFW
jgi:hypothetical protein